MTDTPDDTPDNMPDDIQVTFVEDPFGFNLSEVAEIQELPGELNLDKDIQDFVPDTDCKKDLDLAEIESCMEALLFIADKPLSLDQLHKMINHEQPIQLFNEAMEKLTSRHQEVHHGIELVEVAGGFQLRTKPGRAELAKKLTKIQPQRLSTGAMETLAIVAYRQPVMRDDIDKIRGVDSSYFIRLLMEKGLLIISGRLELPGRPILYSTSGKFLEVFGLRDLASLPPLHELEKMVPDSEVKKEEDPAAKEMQRLLSDLKNQNENMINYDAAEDDKLLNQIREQIKAVRVSTPSLDEQNEAKKELEKLAEQNALAAAASNPTETTQNAT